MSEEELAEWDAHEAAIVAKIAAKDARIAELEAAQTEFICHQCYRRQDSPGSVADPGF